jgi:hypothetical protein
MTKARNIADLLDANGDVKSASLDNVPAVDLTNLSASNLTSGTIPDARVSASAVSQHAVSFDDNAIVNDLSTIALRQATNENAIAYNTNSSFIDVFQDGSGIASNTNAPRNASEYVSSISQVTDTDTKALWTTTIDSHGDAIGGSPGTPIVDSTGTLQLQSTNTGVQTFSSGNAAPISGLGTRSIRTAAWSTGSVDYGGLFIREVSGQESSLPFSGAFTIEMFVKQVSTGYSGAHQYIFDFQNTSNHRVSMSPHGSTGSSAFNGSLMSDGDYDWDSNFGVGNWRHVALVRDGSGNIANFINGTRVQAATGKTENLTMTDSTELSIGQRLNGEHPSYIYINNIRLSNVARYTPTSSSLTVPTSRFSLTVDGVSATGNFIGNTITAPSSTSSMGAIITYQDQAGTNALNTDIVLQLSADGGSNYSTATLTAMPDFSTGIKMAKVNDLAVTAGTSLKYQISFANQSGSKEARIRGVSLQY